jgi:hypothetical protein
VGDEYWLELPDDELPDDELPDDELPVDELPVDELLLDELPLDEPDELEAGEVVEEVADDAVELRVAAVAEVDRSWATTPATAVAPMIEAPASAPVTNRALARGRFCSDDISFTPS